MLCRPLPRRMCLWHHNSFRNPRSLHRLAASKSKRAHGPPPAPSPCRPSVRAINTEWSRNGSPISGATASSYTTPPTAFADTGAPSSPLPSPTSRAPLPPSPPRSHRCAARAPKSGDLRFQQVDAASTINGYTVLPGSLHASEVFCPVPGGGGSGEGFAAATGTSAFFLGNLLCVHQFSVFALPALASPACTQSYVGTTTQDYPRRIERTTLVASGFPGPSDPGSVVTAPQSPARIRLQLLSRSFTATPPPASFQLNSPSLHPACRHLPRRKA